jgi:hypothetical protein
MSERLQKIKVSRSGFSANLQYELVFVVAVAFLGWCPSISVNLYISKSVLNA